MKKRNLKFYTINLQDGSSFTVNDIFLKKNPVLLDLVTYSERDDRLANVIDMTDLPKGHTLEGILGQHELFYIYSASMFQSPIENNTAISKKARGLQTKWYEQQANIILQQLGLTGAYNIIAISEYFEHIELAEALSEAVISQIIGPTEESLENVDDRVLYGQVEQVASDLEIPFNRTYEEFLEFSNTNPKSVEEYTIQSENIDRIYNSY